MIFIIGSDLTEEQLPSFTDYKIFPMGQYRSAKMALRVAANKNLTIAYIHEDLRSEFEVGTLITEELYEKIKFFKDEQYILKELTISSDVNTSEKQAEQDTTQAVETDAKPVQSENKTMQPDKADKVDKVDKADKVDKPAQPSQPPQPSQPVENVADKTEVGKQPANVIELSATQSEDDGVTFMNKEVAGVEDIDDDDDFNLTGFKIPTSAGGNYDAVTAKLEAKEKQLEQYRAMMAERVQEFDETLKEMDAANSELITAYENKLTEATKAFNKVKTDLVYALSTTGKYHLYAERYRSILKEGFEPNIKEAIKSLNLNVAVMCTADNVIDMHYLIQQNIEQFKENCVFVDFTGTSYFDMVYATKQLGGAFALFNTMTDEQKEQFKQTAVFHKENADIIAEYNFHDIAFLDFEWQTFFANLKDIFGDRRIVLLFNSISSFSVLYTVSELATIFKSYLHLRCSHIAIKNAYMRLKFIPKERGIKIVATYLFDDVNDAITQLGKKYVVITSADVLSITSIVER